MNWLQPWAWLGALSVAVPIVIHRLSQRPSRPLNFPSLRFLGDTRVLPVRRARLSDLWLLLVRCAVLAVAAMPPRPS